MKGWYPLVGAEPPTVTVDLSTFSGLFVVKEEERVFRVELRVHDRHGNVTATLKRGRFFTRDEALDFADTWYAQEQSRRTIFAPSRERITP